MASVALQISGRKVPIEKGPPRQDPLRSVLGVWAFVILVGTTLAFGTLCQQLFHQFGGFGGVSRVTSSDSFFFTSDWFPFTLSWLLDSATFNASQVFGWFITPIQVTAWWSRALVVAYSFQIDVLIIAGLVNIARAFIGRMRGRPPAHEQ
jgi:hypothetical protein